MLFRATPLLTSKQFVVKSLGYYTENRLQLKLKLRQVQTAARNRLDRFISFK